MKKSTLTLLVLLCLSIRGLSQNLIDKSDNKISLYLENTVSLQRTDEVVELNVEDLIAKYPDFKFDVIRISQNDKIVPYQFKNSDNDGEPDRILILLDFNPGEKKKITITSHVKRDPLIFSPRTQAVLSVKHEFIFLDSVYTGGRFVNVDSVIVPESHIAHDALYRFEGPGWESDLIAYRVYLDDRFRTDIFGKKTHDLVLQHVGMNDLISDSKESYTKMSDWGMDIFKVGKSLGIGAIAMWHNNTPVTVSETGETRCTISANGPIQSKVTTVFKNWKVGDKHYDLTNHFSITAGSRLTKVELTLNKADTMCTGIAKYPNTNFIKSANEQEWGYIALYGKQTLANDNLGLAVFYNKSEMLKITDDEDSYIVVLNPENAKLTYYFTAAWEQEPSGIKSQKEFEVYLNGILGKLNNPIKVTIH